MMFSEVTEKEYIKERYPHSKANFATLHDHKKCKIWPLI